jgi:hypothetical protein
MANRKITDLAALTAPATGDLLPIVDISEAAAADKNKKITFGELLSSAPDGSAAAPSFSFDSDPNTGIYSPGADQLAISTGGTGRLFVDANGLTKLDSGINAATLTLNSTNPYGTLLNFADTNAVFGVIGGAGAVVSGANKNDFVINYNGTNASRNLIFSSFGTEKARLDSSGRLLVGTSSSTSVAGSAATVQIFGTGGNPHSLQLTRGDAPILSFGKTDVGGGPTLGALVFAGNDGSDVNSIGANILAQIDGTIGVDDMPGRLVFSTTSDGAASPTERMRITSGGNILTNTTSTYSASVCTTDFNSASQFGLTLRDTGSATDAVMMYFYKSGNVRGNITTTATATAFNTSSDYRLKRDVVPIENASSRVQQLRPVNFAWEETGSRCDGFLAHEAQAVVPECVTGEKDAVDDDGNPVYQGIDQSKLVPLLTAALQEAIGEIESLKARVVALEGA